MNERTTDFMFSFTVGCVTGSVWAVLFEAVFHEPQLSLAAGALWAVVAGVFAWLDLRKQGAAK